MESLAANRKSSLDLVQLRIAYLIKHCETKEVQLQDIDYHEGQVGAVSDKACAASCNCGGILESANPQAIRPSKLHQLKDRTHAMLREHYADKMKIYEPAWVSVLESDTTLFEAFFAGSSSAPTALQENGCGVPLHVCNEVD